MLKLLERNIEALEHRLVLLAPPSARLSSNFNNVTVDSTYRRQFLRAMQAFRGSIYLQEGNITSRDLTVDGLHQTPEDEKSWHLVMTDGEGRVTSCAWYRDYENRVSVRDLRVRNCPLLESSEWSGPLVGAIDWEIARARRSGLHFAELGGWAILRENRCTPEGLMMALATYGLSRSLGGALGITTANVMHSCASILRRLGGSHLEFDGQAIPSYFDPKYNTNIELLRFDSRQPSQKYAGLIDVVRAQLSQISVIASSRHVAKADRYLDTVRVPQPVMAA